MTDEQLAEIKERWAAATAFGNSALECDDGKAFVCDSMGDFPALLAEIDRLRETLKRLQAHLDCDDETILIGLDEARQDINAALNP